MNSTFSRFVRKQYEYVHTIGLDLRSKQRKFVTHSLWNNDSSYATSDS